MNKLGSIKQKNFLAKIHVKMQYFGPKFEREGHKIKIEMQILFF